MTDGPEERATARPADSLDPAPAGGMTGELYALLLASVRDYAIFAVDAAGRVASWNVGAERLKGYAASEILGRHLSTFYPPEQRGPDGLAPRVAELLARAAREGRAEDEAWRVRKDGSRFWANVVITPIRDASGAPIGFAKVTRDLTARREKEARERELAAERAAREVAERDQAELRLLAQRLEEQATELEQQTEEAQALAEELEQANEQLQDTAREAEEARDAADGARRVAEELEQRTRRIFDASPLPSWIVDLETQRLLDVNDAAVARYGWSREEFAGLTLRDLREPGATPVLDAALRETLERGEWRGTTRHRTRDGERLDVEVNSRLLSVDGRPAMITVVTDITARLRAQARAEFLAEAGRLLAASLDYDTTLEALARAAVPRLADWCAVDMVAEGNGEAWPPTLRRLAVMHQDPAKVEWAHEVQRKYPTDWSQPRGLPRVLREGVTEFFPDVPDAVLVAAARSPEHLALLRELGFRAALVVPLRARGRVVGAITLVMADSGRRYDDDDRRLAEELAHRASLAVEHAALYREAQQANAAKMQFLATMSHELRTPLNAIGGYAQLLELGVHGPLAPEQRDDVARIQRSQRHLLALIDDVLDVARIESGQVRFRLERVPVGEVLDAVLTLVEPQARSRGLALDAAPCDAALAVRADRERLQQVLLNLAANAVKFTPEGGRVTFACERRGDTVEVSVADTGIGIPEDRLASIFEPFVQVESGLTRTAGGTGLGLAISRDLVRGMGGSLRVRSALGEGSTFTLALPAADG